MKILVVTNVYPSDKHPYHGIFVSEQLKAVKKLHDDVEFDVFYINGFAGKLQYIKSIWKIAKTINNDEYDLVHIHYGLAGMYLYWPFIKKVPTVVTFHGSDIQPKGGNGRISEMVSIHTAKKAEAAIILNDEMETMVKPYCKNTNMIPCAVDLDVFKPMEKSKQNKKIYIVFPSNHERRVKNYPLFCDVMEILKTKYGLNVEEKELKGLTRVEIAQLYSNSDLLLMTSNSEGSPQAVKEAMACNLPCVSTPVGDVRLLLSNVKDCYVSSSHDATELAELVVKSLQRTGKGILGREKISNLHLDEESIANKVYQIYSSLLSKPKDN